MALRLILIMVFVVSVPCVATEPSSTTARGGVVVSDHRLASEAGVEAMKRGGNAVDAAVATAFALAVVHPSAGNLGGGGFLVYHGADGKVLTFDFREKAPLASSPTMFLDAQGRLPKDANHRGIRTVGVPGTVAGLLLAHDRLGSAPLALLVQPAIDLAERGFPLSQALHDEFTSEAALFREYPSSAKIFLDADGKPWPAGHVWRQPDLAATLERIRDRGRDGFYQGRTAELTVETTERYGGLITRDDLAAYQAIARRPVHGTYRGYDVWSMGPPSSGGTAIVEMLNILEGFELATMGHNTPRYLHVLTESMRRAFRDRARWMGDPDFNGDLPIARLTSKDHARALRQTIDLGRASVSSITDVNDRSRSTQTTHLSVVDARRNAVSLTYTLEEGYGSRIVVASAGFLLNNEMGDFNPIPGHTDTSGTIGTRPNLIAPGKRMLSSMSPTIVAKDGRPVLVIGSPGGRTIINTVLQVILNVIDFEMPLPQAIAAGRIHHQWLPDVTSIESHAVDANALKEYESLGHKVKHVDRQGRAMGVFIDWERGLLIGAPDPRSPDGAAVGY